MPIPVNGPLTEQALRDIASLRQKFDDFQASRFSSAISLLGIIVILILAAIGGIWGITVNDASERSYIWREVVRVSEVQKNVIGRNDSEDASIKDLEARVRTLESLVGKLHSSGPP